MYVTNINVGSFIFNADIDYECTDIREVYMFGSKQNIKCLLNEDTLAMILDEVNKGCKIPINGEGEV